MGKIERPSLESLIMDFAMSLTRRATCKRFQVGCVITSEDMTQIYGFGYNGTAKGLSHDDCKSDQQGSCGCVHSEVNALIKVRANDPRKVVFVTAQPCITCAKAIVNSGVSKVYYRATWSVSESDVGPTGTRNGSGSRGRAGCRSRRSLLGRGRRLRELRDEIADHRGEGVHEPSRETFLPEAQHIGLLQPASDVQVEVDSVQGRKEGRIGSELGPEAAEVHHAGGRETDSPQEVRDVAQLGR